MGVEDYKQQVRGSDEQVSNRERLAQLYESSPIPTDQMMINFPLYMRSSVIAKMLYFNELYQQILEMPGIVMEFGVWWGQNLALLENLRAVHEPYNHARRIVGFDTFEGYPEVGERDRASDTVKIGGYTVSAGYESYLREVLACHEAENVTGHIKKTDIVKGDAGETVPRYLRDNPEAMIALAEFDMALYAPTKAVLEAILPRCMPGSVIALDEFNCRELPGETEAVREVLHGRSYRIRRSRFLPDRTYIVL